MKKSDSISNIINTIKDIRKKILPKEWQGKKLPIRLVMGRDYDESKGWVTKVYFEWSWPVVKK